MNWVGGSRSRFMKKSDTKKQREFFEKKRMQKRLDHLRPPSSPKEGNAVNMDLLTMFIVNQISLKKEHVSKPKIRQADLKGPHTSVEKRPLELPMSPCSPSALNLAHSKPQYSPHTLGLKKRKSLLEDFKFKMSPVQECSLSDNSGSDYQRHLRDNLSSFSPASSISAEMFNLQPRPIPRISCPSPWKYSGAKEPRPEGACKYDPWTAMPYQAQIPQTSPRPRVQFGSTLRSTETSMPSADLEEYMLKPLVKKKYQEKSLFLGFNNEEFRHEDLLSKSTYKIQETHTTLRRAYEPHSTDHNADFLPQQIHRYADCRACSVHTTDTKNTSESSAYCSPREGCARSDDVEDHKQCLQTCAPLMCYSPDSRFWSEMSATSLSPTLALSKQGIPNHNNTSSDGICGKESLRYQDTGAYTTADSTSASCDALVEDALLKEHGTNIYPELTAAVQQCGMCNERQTATTRRQTGYINLLTDTPCGVSESHKVMWNTPWKMFPTRETKQQARKAITEQENSCRPPNLACIKKRLLFPLNSSHISAPESSENVAVRGGRCEGHKRGGANPDPTRSAGGTEEHHHDDDFGAEKGASWVTEETETLHEIANILLMLKYRNKHA